MAKGYLAERFVVRYLPTVNALLFDGTGREAKLRILGIGHPGTTDWDVEYELRDIQAFYKDARLRFGQQAVFAALQNERADILHLSLELQSNFRVPSTASVLLSDGQSTKGTHSTPWGELLSLPGFSVVVFSDLGSSGASLHGSLAAMFLMNGSGNVVLNSYPPLRRSKKYFGEIFYTALLSGATTEAAAQRVQQEMIKNREYSSPYVWAPYFLWGK
jgi:CHAT domain-containing protein